MRAFWLQQNIYSHLGLDPHLQARLALTSGVSEGCTDSQGRFGGEIYRYDYSAVSSSGWLLISKRNWNILHCM